MWYYYYLTDEGITYLRDFLAIDADVQPETRKKAAPRPSAPAGARGERGERGGFRGERRQFSDDRKLGSAPGSYEPNFVCIFFLFSHCTFLFGPVVLKIFCESFIFLVYFFLRIVEIFSSSYVFSSLASWR